MLQCVLVRLNTFQMRIKNILFKLMIVSTFQYNPYYEHSVPTCYSVTWLIILLTKVLLNKSQKHLYNIHSGWLLSILFFEDIFKKVENVKKRKK